MAASAVNGTSADINGGAVKTTAATTTQQPNRAPSNTKGNDGTRKDIDDSAQRRAPQTKAWTSGVNPITQRPNTPSSINGSANKSHSKNASSESRPTDRGTLDRQAAFMSANVGLECKIRARSGEAFSGIFAGAKKVADDQKFLFKMVKPIQLEPSGESADLSMKQPGLEYTGVGPDHSMVFSLNNLISMDIPEASTAPRAATPNGAPSSFRTDADISGGASGGERRFQKWESPTGNTDADLSLDSAGEWDQFKTNEEKFGLKSSYDENLYTTTIDRNNPLYALREREAARIAREIEGDISGNAHMREERGHRDDGADEEERYSGVRRNGQDHASLQSTRPNRYMSPARRAQASNTSAVEGAIDPAIISSQIARTEPSESTKAERNSGAPAQIKTESAAEKSKVEAKLDKKNTTKPKELKPLRQPSKLGTTATENVETEVLDSFRQFAASEKIKVQDHKRSRATADKAVKLNDLMKFSQNFKLLTPVPNDLVPILARDEGKQKAIVQKALKNCDESKTAKTALMDPKTQRPLAAARLDKETAALDAASHPRLRHDATGHGLPLSKDRQQQTRDFLQHRMHHGGFSSRLADSHKLHKAGQVAAVPQPLPIQDSRMSSGRNSELPSALPSPQKANSLRGPPSAASSKFNVKASEFRPNPAASTFKPVTGSMTNTAASSPRSTSVTRHMSPSTVQPKLFGDKTRFGKPGERPDPINLVAPKKPADQEVEASKEGNDDSAKSSGPALPASNGGFQYPHKTHPTWNPPDEEGAEPPMKYWEPFEKLKYGRHASPQGKTSPVNPTPHVHQLPLHLQNGTGGVPQLHTPQPLPQQMNPQHQHFPHGPQFDEHHHRPSVPNAPAYQAVSPRMQNSNIAYHSPMPPHAQLAYSHPGQYVMHAAPPMNGRQFSSGPQMMPVPGGHLAPMMVQQQSSGGYGPPMLVQYNAQGPMYASPAPPMYATPSQPPSGYPSPGRGAPIMMHQGSHQGHNQPVYIPAGQFGQPMYAQQPPPHMPNARGTFGSPQPHFPQHQFPQQQFSHQPHQPHRTPSNGYVQPHHMHHHHAGAQQAPPPTVPTDVGEEAK